MGTLTNEVLHWQTSFALWLFSLHTTLKTPNTVQHIQKRKLEPGEFMTLYDGKALFTSVPVDLSINIVKQKLHQDKDQDPTLPQRTNMFIQQIVTLLDFCLKNIYFFQGK